MLHAVVYTVQAHGAAAFTLSHLRRDAKRRLPGVDTSAEPPRQSPEGSWGSGLSNAPPRAQQHKRSSVSMSMMKGTMDAVRDRVRQGKQRRRVDRLKAALVAMETQVASPCQTRPRAPALGCMSLHCMPHQRRIHPASTTQGRGLNPKRVFFNCTLSGRAS